MVCSITSRIRGQFAGIATGMVALFVAVGGAGYAATGPRTNDGAGAEFARIEKVPPASTSCGAVSGTSTSTSCMPGPEMFPPGTTVKARDLDVRSNDAGVSVTLQVNGVDTALTCTVAATQSCLDVVHKVKIPSGSFVRFKVVTPANIPTLNILVGWRAVGTS